MGVKRPFEEEFEEVSFKQPKQLDSENKLTSFPGAFSSHDLSQANDDKGGEEGDKSKLYRGYHDDDIHATLNLGDKELETSVPLSWVTSSSSEEDVGSVEPLYLPLFPEYFEFNFPRRSVLQLEDAYSAMLNSSPRRQVPVGPDHQADVPLWSSDAVHKEPGHSVDDENTHKFLGTPICPLPELDNASYDDLRVGQGRKCCECFDEGSIRCVQQHVKEVREKLKEVFGEGKFTDLGLYDMGEEVALRWTEEEERISHKVIFSNPASLGKNFWRQLSAVFPSRTKMEFVSYYFNVFMLRRRAVQNRSDFLEIDSDDDEWHGNIGDLSGVGEDEDSVVESLPDQDLREGSGDDDDDEEEEENDGDDDGSDDGEGHGDFGGKNIASAVNDDAVNHDLSCQISKSHFGNLTGVICSDSVVLRDSRIQEDSTTSSETQQYMQNSSCSESVQADTQRSENDDFRGCPAGQSNSSNDGSESESVFLLENCDAQVWNGSCSTGLVKSVDLLPTCNMIEEIFGPFTSKSN